MKNIFIILTLLFVSSTIMFSCSSAQKVSSMKKTEKGDQIADKKIVCIEKKVVSSSNGKPTEYNYILNKKIVAKELLNKKVKLFLLLVKFLMV